MFGLNSSFLRKSGTLAIVLVSMMNPEHCHVEGCPKIVKARGYCATHYKQWMRTGQTRLELQEKLQIETYQLSPVRVSIRCVEILKTIAGKKNITVPQLQRSILEEWAEAQV